MKKTLSIALFAACALFAGQSFAAAHAMAGGCEAKAVDKNGKALAGAAKTSFMKKCEAGGDAASTCATKAVDKNGKALAGAAKTSFMKKCEKDAPAAKKG